MDESGNQKGPPFNMAGHKNAIDETTTSKIECRDQIGAGLINDEHP